MKFGKWLGIVCTLCIAAPAQLRAATDWVPAEVSSFAYAKRHALWPLPDKVIARTVDPDKFARTLNAVFYRDESSRKPLDPRAGVPHRLSLRSFCDALSATAQQNELPVQFFANLIWQESRFNVYSVSHAGALGIAQFIPKTAEGYGLINPFEPIHAINAAARYLRELRAQFGNLGLAAMAYNAGPRRVIDWRAGRGALPSETRNYVVRITGRSADRWADADANIDTQMSLKAPCPELRLMATEQAQQAPVAGVITEPANTSPLATNDSGERPQASEAAAKSHRTGHSARNRLLHRGVASSR